MQSYNFFLNWANKKCFFCEKEGEYPLILPEDPLNLPRETWRKEGRAKKGSGGKRRERDGTEILSPTNEQYGRKRKEGKERERGAKGGRTMSPLG